MPTFRPSTEEGVYETTNSCFTSDLCGRFSSEHHNLGTIRNCRLVQLSEQHAVPLSMVRWTGSSRDNSHVGDRSDSRRVHHGAQRQIHMRFFDKTTTEQQGVERVQQHPVRLHGIRSCRLQSRRMGKFLNNLQTQQRKYERLLASSYQLIFQEPLGRADVVSSRAGANAFCDADRRSLHVTRPAKSALRH
jgi:hypothetical protein